MSSSAPAKKPSKTFLFVTGSNLTGDPDAVGVCLEKLRVKKKGKLTPEDVVSAAKAASSPLHLYFEWDDAEAAHQHRLNQARYLLRSVRVVHVAKEGTHEIAVSSRAFVNLNTPGDRSKSIPYYSVEDVLADPDKRSKYIANAAKELATYAKKYRHLVEFSGVFSALDKLLDESA